MRRKKYDEFYKKLGLIKTHKHKNNFKKDESNDLLEFTKQVVIINDELAKKEEIHLHDPKFDKKIISLQDISLFYKRLYRPITVIFDHLNLDIYEEEITCIVGPNGIGKTTLFELIIQVRKPNKGKVIFYDDAINKNPYKYISMQTQDFNFPTGLLVKDVVEFIIELQQIDITKNIGEYKRMLRIFQLDKIWLNKASKLSGGQQQRLNLFISLLNHPKVLLLDEYATGLDIKTK
ncbi:ATP-binding cassette domain-containing protein [bacterium]|nr:ATP-binding cassette domain-containing protein [bacterium]